jgi:hypothetical protein
MGTPLLLAQLHFMLLEDGSRGVGDILGSPRPDCDDARMNHLSQRYVTTHITLIVNRVIYVRMELWL